MKEKDRPVNNPQENQNEPVKKSDQSNRSKEISRKGKGPKKPPIKKD